MFLRRLSVFFPLLATAFFCFVPRMGAHAATLTPDNLRIANYSTFSRIILKLDAPASARVGDAMKADGYFYVDLYGVTAQFPDKLIPVQDDILKAVQTKTYPANKVVRVIIYPVRKTNFRVVDPTANRLLSAAPISDLKPASEKLATVQIDIARDPAVPLPTLNAPTPVPAVKPTVPAATPKPSTGPAGKIPGKHRVILDPGHGGRSLGCVYTPKGQTPVYEKTLVLEICREAARLLEKTGNIEPILTHADDTYVGLKERIEFAESREGDLFVSIHVNATGAARNGNQGFVRGIEFYYLSKTSSADTMALTEIENQEVDAPLDKESSAQWNLIEKYLIQDILEMQRASGAEICGVFSRVFSKDAYYKTYNHGIKRAAFRVLKNRVMPATLVEVGYLDNPKEREQLTNPAFRMRIAALVAESIQEYFTLQDKGDPGIGGMN